LISDKMKTLVRVGENRARDSEGTTVRLHSNTIKDLRDASAFRKHEVVLRDRGKFVWIRTTEGGGPDEETLKAVGLMRDVPTEFFAQPSMIRFRKHTVSQEVEYVLEHVRPRR
jgi:hypothetical protein